MNECRKCGRNRLLEFLTKAGGVFDPHWTCTAKKSCKRVRTAK